MNNQKTLTVNGIIFISIFFTGVSFAQVEEKKNEYQDRFEEFKKGISEDFENFKSENDSIFLKFLEDSWEEFKMFRDEKPGKPKPSEQPKVTEETGSGYEITPVKENIEILDTTSRIHRMLWPANRQEYERLNNRLDFNFFGAELMTFYNNETLPRLRAVSEAGIADFFRQAAENPLLNLTVGSLRSTADSIKLNDWGFVLLLKDAASRLFHSGNDQKLFVWYSLIKNGFDVRAGFNDTRVFLLVNTQLSLFNTYYFIANGIKYYHVRFQDDPEEVYLLIAHNTGYPGSYNNISLYIETLPALGNDKISRSFRFRDKTLDIPLNKNLIEFYNSFPNSDLSLYFKAPLSEEVLDSFQNFFSVLFSDKNEVEIVNILLEFLQYSIAYQTDHDQFGVEKYMFAEEALYYPYSDCEDRSVLLAGLIKHFTGLPLLVLDYPSHVTLAVAFFEKNIGDFVEYNKNKYYVCDPTLIGGKVGTLMSSLREIHPQIYDYYEILP